MMNAYHSGDPYLAFAKQAGAAPADATKATHKAVREQFKACVLAVQYGMGGEALAQRIGVRTGGDDDAPAPRPQRPLDEGCDLVEQRVAVVVKAHEMPGFAVLAGQQVVGLDQHGRF